jgi:urease accessory protein
MHDSPEPHSHDFPPEALPPATGIVRAGEWSGAHDLVVLTYDERFLRRKRLETVHQETFVVDLPKVTHVDHRDAFVLQDGRLIEVIAAKEPLVEVTGANLAFAAWHIGNRHTPCQIEPDRLLIRQDHVLEGMLAQLGVTVAHVSEPFTPVGGAYGAGRTMGHDHGHDHHHEHADTPSRHTVLSRTGRVQHVEAEDLPSRGPFDDSAE